MALEYIVVKEDGIFFKDKSTKHYLGEKVVFPDDALNLFKQIQQKNSNILELHVLSSETPGNRAEKGNPSEKTGIYSWCRIKLANEEVGPWVCCDKYKTLKACSRQSVFYCVFNVLHNKQLQNSLLGTALSQSEYVATVVASQVKGTKFPEKGIKTINIPDAGYSIVIVKDR